MVTGRNAKRELIEAADLVTEMTLVKHHFAAGVKAQAGHRVLMSRPRPHAARHRVERRQVAARRRALRARCARRGLIVRPFKPQNMSNNAAVTADGGEIGRAQALQALRRRVAPSVHMNPVLLKPQSEIGAQVIVQGKVLRHARRRARCRI